MKKIIWRSRVITILGFLVLILAFDGLPEFVHQVLLVVFGVAIIALGFSGNKYANQMSHKYTDEDDLVKTNNQGNLRSLNNEIDQNIVEVKKENEIDKEVINENE